MPLLAFGAVQKKRFPNGRLVGAWIEQ